MARTATDSKSQTARQRARQAMADELERARKRETQLAAVFTAIDTLDEAKTSLGSALTELKYLGVPHSELATKTGLSAREITSALRSAKNETHRSDDSNTSNETDTNAAAPDTKSDDGSGTN